MSTRPLIVMVVLLVLALGVGIGAQALSRNDPWYHPRAAFRDPNPAVRVAAIRALGWHEDASFLIPALRDENADVRLMAAMRLGGAGAGGTERAKALVEALDDPHLGVRREASEALCSIGPKSGPVLCRALGDPRPRVRAGAARALSGAGCGNDGRQRAPGERDTALPLLRKLLADEDAEVRDNAATALQRIARIEGRSIEDR
jgi:HEAT repeat protein